MKRFLQLANVASVIFAIAANAIVATSDTLPAIGSVSDMYSTLLTPATYAFSIWTFIYTMIALLALWQARDVFNPKESNDLPQKMAGWFILANLMNGIWTYVFVQNEIILSLAIILTLLASLFVLIKRLDIAIYDAPLSTIFFVWWAILPYTGWVLAASVVNAAVLATVAGYSLTAPLTTLVIMLLTVVLSFLLWKRNARSLVLASAWGIAAIAVAQYDLTPLVAYTAMLAAAVLLIQTTIHAYQNRATSPLVKLRDNLASKS